VVEVLDINIYGDPNIKNVHISIITLMLSHHYLIMQWSPRDALPSPISSAVYTSDGLLVYAGFRDGAIGIFEAESLRLRCRIAASAYIPSSVSRYVQSPTVSVESGAILILVANNILLLLPSGCIFISSGGGVVYPMAVSVYPWLNPNQIALGMSDGAVHVLEPLED
jgi:hypothetical protein